MIPFLFFLAVAASAAAQPAGLAALMPSPKPGASKSLDPKKFRYEEWQTEVRKVGMAVVQGRQTECDRLTANAHDPGLTAKPVAFDALDARAATAACRRDLARDPDNGRLMNNLGRARNKAKDYAASLRWTTKAAEAGYPYAHHVMALHYRYGEGVAKDRAQELAWLKKAREKGVPAASLSLAQYAMQGFEGRDYDPGAVRELLLEADQGRGVSWAWGDFYFYQAIRDFHGESLDLLRRGIGFRARKYKSGELPGGDAISTRFGPARLTEFRNLLRAAKAHYEDAERTGVNQLRRRRLAAIGRTLAAIRDRYAMR